MDKDRIDLLMDTLQKEQIKLHEFLIENHYNLKLESVYNYKKGQYDLIDRIFKLLIK
jgi:hypothetical protein